LYAARPAGVEKVAGATNFWICVPVLSVKYVAEFNVANDTPPVAARLTFAALVPAPRSTTRTFPVAARTSPVDTGCSPTT
jgi:hypothetical protein